MPTYDQEIVVRPGPQLTDAAAPPSTVTDTQGQAGAAAPGNADAPIVLAQVSPAERRAAAAQNRRPPQPPAMPRTATDLGDDYLRERAGVHAAASAPDAWLTPAAPAASTEEAAPPARDAARQQEEPQAPPQGTWGTLWQVFRGTSPLFPEGRQVLGFIARGMVEGGPELVQPRASARAVASDIAQGAVEAPLAVARGAAGAVEQVFRSADEFAKLLNDHADLRVDSNLPEALNNPARALADLAGAARGTIAERQSVTGRMVEGVAQWLTAAAMTRRVAGRLGVPDTTWTRIINDFVAGGIGFDPRENRVSEQVQAIAPNPVTEWLLAGNEDAGLEARAKAGLEAAGLGTLAQGVFQGLRLLRQWRGISSPAADRVEAAAPGPRRASVPSGGTAPAPAQPTGPRDYLSLVAPDAPAVEVTPEAAERAMRWLNGGSGTAPVRLNLLRIEGDDAVRDALKRIDTMLPEHVPESLDAVRQAARELGMQPGDVLRGADGEIMSARQITAARMLLRAASDDLIRLAERARAPDASDLERLAFNKAFALTYGIQQQVRGQSAAIGRALNAHRIMASTDSEATKAIQELLARSGGSEGTADLAERIAALADPAKASAFVAQAAQATTRDQINTIWANILLSNPGSLVVNVLDTTMAQMAEVPTTWVASLLGNNVPPGAASARLFGLVQGMRDGWRLAGATLRTGESAFGGPVMQQAEGRGAAGIAADGMPNASLTGAVGDYLRMLMPTRLMAAGDELTKSMAYRASLYENAYARGAQEGLEGEALGRRIGELVNDPPPWLATLAQKAAIDDTFNTPLTGAAAHFQGMVDRINLNVPGITDSAGNAVQIPVGRMLVATFIRTPYNVFRWTALRSPMGVLAPSVQADIAAGGARADMAIARIATGSSFMAIGADLTMQGVLTGAGPSDPQLRQALDRTGWKPYSVKIGDQYIPFARFGTLGTLLGYAAVAAERVTGVYTRDKNAIDMDGNRVTDTAAAALVLPMAQVMQDKTMVSGFSRLLQAIADPERRGDRWINGFVASFVPAGVAGIERATDPTIRQGDPKSMVDAVLARIPGLSEQVAPALDLWGRERNVEGEWLNVISPVIPQSARPNAIDKWFVDARWAPQMPERVQSFAIGNMQVPVELSPERYNHFVRLAGNGIEGVQGSKPFNVDGRPAGAFDFLNAVADGKAGSLSQQWDGWSDERRQLFVREILTNAREAARKIMLRDDADLRGLVAGQAQARGERIMAPRDQQPARQPAPVLQ